MPACVLFVLPADVWAGGQSAPGSVRALVREAVNLRRRVAKGANLDAERARYSALLNALEGQLPADRPAGGPLTPAAAKQAAAEKRVAAFALPPAYFDLLARAHLDRAGRRGELDGGAGGLAGAEAGGSVFPPQVLAAHAAELDKLAATLEAGSELRRVAVERAAVVRAVADAGGGIVEVGDDLDDHDAPPPPERPVPPPAPPPPPEPPPLTATGRRKMAERFTHAVRAALPAGGRVNLSDQPHEVSTEVLAGFLYADPREPAGRVRVVYADGSEAKPFPLRGVPPPARPTPPTADPVAGVVELKVALMSMRHPELDPFVERAWYRNKEVSVTRPLAESDDFCFAYSVKELAELREVYAGETLLVRVFHTGFEPAAVGLYRAVAAELHARRGWLRVLPMYYRGGTRFETGKVVWE